MQVPVGREVFRLILVDGAIDAGDTTAAIEIDYAAREFHLSRCVPEPLRPAVVAAAVNTVWERRTVPLLHPKWSM